ncbi:MULTISPECIES: hypothetical protein [unclassified Blastococcus]
MDTQLDPYADTGTDGGTGTGTGVRDDGRRPNVAGDLPTLFRAAPMFGRAVAGYDRYQVDTYVQWAEDELATAEREREHLLARFLRTQADLDDARRLLAHSPGGGELLQLSARIGSMLAAAADEADGIRADARAERSAACAEARRVVTRAGTVLAEAGQRARRLADEAATAAAEVIADAGRRLDAAEATRRAAAEEAAALRAELRLLERRAEEAAEAVRQRAARDADDALLRARADAVRLLAAGREQRRRADEQAAAARDRADRAAADRRAALLAEVAGLERRRAALADEVARLSAAVPLPPRAPDGLRRVLVRLRPRRRPLPAS